MLKNDVKLVQGAAKHFSPLIRLLTLRTYLYHVDKGRPGEFGLSLHDLGLALEAV